MTSDNPFDIFPPARPAPIAFPPAPIAFPPALRRGEFTAGLPAAPASDLQPPPPGLDVEQLIRAAFAAGNRMIIIAADDRGLYQTSMKRRDGKSFAVEVKPDVIASIRGALSLL